MHIVNQRFESTATKGLDLIMINWNDCPQSIFEAKWKKRLQQIIKTHIFFHLSMVSFCLCGNRPLQPRMWHVEKSLILLKNLLCVIEKKNKTVSIRYCFSSKGNQNLKRIKKCISWISRMHSSIYSFYSTMATSSLRPPYRPKNANENKKNFFWNMY